MTEHADPRRPFVHLWFYPRRFRALDASYRSCLLCGAVQPADPARIKGCRGSVRIVTRSA